MDNEFQQEVERLRRGNVPGAAGRLRQLFDYLADRGPTAEAASQADIASAVFDQHETHADDATVRVYIHRLRKRLEDHYRAHPPADGAARLELPAGIYALRVLAEDAAADPATATGPAISPADSSRRFGIGTPALLAVLLVGVVAMIAGFALGYGLFTRADPPNAIWRTVVASDRPVLVVLGDYYMFGEIDPVRPEEGRLIRDFRVNGPEDLLRLQEAEPQRYAMAEDFGVNYLPTSTAHGLSEIAPLLEANNKPVSILRASQIEADMLNYYDIVYIGLLSGLDLLEDRTFAGSGFRLGESYDELVDRETGQRYVSEEARSLASPAFYRDFAYVARYRAPGGALVTIIASERDTGLRGISPLVASAALPEDVREAAGGGEAFEALFQITGQQGADLNNRLILARPRE